MIAEDNFLIREGCIEPLLNTEFSIEASVDNGRDAIVAVVEHPPAVALLDISMPGMNGFETARKTLALRPSCGILLVTNYAEPSYVQAAKEKGIAWSAHEQNCARKLGEHGEDVKDQLVAGRLCVDLLGKRDELHIVAAQARHDFKQVLA